MNQNWLGRINKINKSSTDKDIIEGLFSLALIKCNDINIISEITTILPNIVILYKENDLSISDIDKDKSNNWLLDQYRNE